MSTSIGKLQYLLYALMIFTLTGCGASNLARTGNSNEPGSIAGKLAWGEGKTAAKATASVPVGVTSIQMTVTGTGNDGKAIPVVRSTSTDSSQASIGGIYPGKVTVTVKAFTGGTVSYEGFAIGVVVVSGTTTTLANPIVMSKPVEKAQDSGCIQCHETTLDTNGQNLVADFKQSGHYTNASWTANDKFGVTGTGCAGCHGPSHNDPDPSASGRCYECHGGVLVASHKGNDGLIVANNCVSCHQPHNIMAFEKGKCIACHALGQDATASGNYVNDNSGVRAITSEFGKWSHHVTGVTLNDAHCAACHLEGKIVDGEVVVDTSLHMADAKTHLRDADTDADFAWDPAAPNHTGMDNFCMSCHDGNGATSPMSAKIQAFINANGIAAAGKTATPTNPFGDTISNQYDKMERPAVVDASGQFATSNNSHHAVKGKRYSGRSRASKGGTIADAAFTANSSATLPGARSTIYDAGRFTTTYTTLANAGGESGARNGGATLGDDSTLHCGDCHTVGQWKANIARNADGSLAPAAIGAHGSNNEYLLRNMIGTDQRHVGQQLTAAGVYISTGNYLICFNCHKISSYGNGQGHDGERAGSEQCNGPYNTRSEPIPGLLNKISSLTPVATEYTGIGEDRLKSVITQIGGTTAGAWSAQTTGHGGMLGNIYGIQCANCHNSGVDNGFGGIHGSKSQTYTDGIGNTTKHERFLPGLGNAMFVPGTKGGYVGGTTALYRNYSGYAFNKYSATSATNRAIKAYPTAFAELPVRNTPYGAGTTGSFTYTTGGVTNDLNWEQKTAGYDNGSTSTSQGISGCYTLSVKGTVRVNALASAGYPADDVRLSPSDGMLAVDGKEALDNWGGCEDHGSVAGRSSEPFTRGIVRPITY